MAQPLVVGMPMNLDLAPGYVLRVTAVNPASGAVVSGVTVDQVVIEGEGSGDFSNGLFTVANPILLGVGL